MWAIMWICVHFFFFQAEDGIRDGRVTGVQTCALPISDDHRSWAAVAGDGGGHCRARRRSEERRVGKSVDLGGRRIIKKKKKAESDTHLNDTHTKEEHEATANQIKNK